MRNQLLPGVWKELGTKRACKDHRAAIGIIVDALTEGPRA